MHHSRVRRLQTAPEPPDVSDGIGGAPRIDHRRRMDSVLPDPGELWGERKNLDVNAERLEPADHAVRPRQAGRAAASGSGLDAR